MNYKVLNEKYTSLIQNSVITDKEKQRLVQVKGFLDQSLKDVMVKNFGSNEDKIAYMTKVMMQLRDFLISDDTENSFKINLLQAFKKIEEDMIEEVIADQQKNEENEDILISDKKKLKDLVQEEKSELDLNH